LQLFASHLGLFFGEHFGVERFLELERARASRFVFVTEMLLPEFSGVIISPPATWGSNGGFLDP